MHLSLERTDSYGAEAEQAVQMSVSVSTETVMIRSSIQSGFSNQASYRDETQT
jgi:hypothetical protein